MHPMQDWKKRIVFRGGALCVGLATFVFAGGSEYANALHLKITAYSPPLGLLSGASLGRWVHFPSHGEEFAALLTKLK